MSGRGGRSSRKDTGGAGPGRGAGAAPSAGSAAAGELPAGSCRRAEPALLLPGGGAAVPGLSSPDLGGRPAAPHGCFCHALRLPRTALPCFLLAFSFFPRLVHCLESCTFPCVTPYTPVCEGVSLNLDVCSCSHLVIVTMYRM